MTTRFRINALAFAVLVAGTVGLAAGTPAEAADFDGCDDYRAARLAGIQQCQSLGYQKMTVTEGWCTSTNFSINYTCG
jgi:hypothetical protein